jgi:hypothetical protein
VASRVNTAPNTKLLSQNSFAVFANRRPDVDTRQSDSYFVDQAHHRPNVDEISALLFDWMAGAVNGLVLQSIITNMLIVVELGRGQAASR